MGLGKAEGFCDEAWKAIYSMYLHCLTVLIIYFIMGIGLKKPGIAIVSCNDGLRPVIFKLETTDIESTSDD